MRSFLQFGPLWHPRNYIGVVVKYRCIWISFAFFEKYFYKENCWDWQIEGIGVDEPSTCLSSGRSLRPHSRCSAPFTLRLSLIGFLGNRQSCSVCARTRQLTGLFTWRQSHVAKEAVFNNYDQSTITMEWIRIQCSSVPQTGLMASSAVYLQDYPRTQALCVQSFQRSWFHHELNVAFPSRTYFCPKLRERESIFFQSPPGLPNKWPMIYLMLAHSARIPH